MCVDCWWLFLCMYVTLHMSKFSIKHYLLTYQHHNWCMFRHTLLPPSAVVRFRLLHPASGTLYHLTLSSSHRLLCHSRTIKNVPISEIFFVHVFITVRFYYASQRGLRNNNCYFSHVKNFWLTLALLYWSLLINFAFCIAFERVWRQISCVAEDSWYRVLIQVTGVIGDL